MQYNVAQLLKEPIGSTRSYRIDGPVPAAEGVRYTFSKGQLSLMRTDKGIWVSARVEARVPATCSRCLKGTTHPLVFSIEEEYMTTVDVSSGQPLPKSRDAEGIFSIDSRHILDLDEGLRQYIITNQPMKPVCREDCRGLCHVCGTDRNENPCACQDGAAEAKRTTLMEILGKESR